VLDGISGRLGSSPPARQAQALACASQNDRRQIDSDFLDAVRSSRQRPECRNPRARSAWASEAFSKSGLVTAAADSVQRQARIAQPDAGRPADARRGRFGGGEIAFDDIQGTLAGGNAMWSAGVAPQRGGNGGAQQVLARGADAMAIWPGEGAAPCRRRLGLSAALEASRLSTALMAVSITGAGTVALEDEQIAGLDPRAFKRGGQADARVSYGDRNPRIRTSSQRCWDGATGGAAPSISASPSMPGQERTGSEVI